MGTGLAHDREDPGRRRRGVGAPAPLRNLTAEAVMGLQRSAGNQAVARLAARGAPRGVSATTRALIQRVPIDPGQRITFTHKKKTRSGIVVAIRTADPDDAKVVYEVDANLDGIPTSILVKNGKFVQSDMPNSPDIDEDIDKILGYQVRAVTDQMLQGFQANGLKMRARVGDLLIGEGIVVRKPDAVQGEPPAVTTAKSTFVEDVLRDLWIISQTKSGKGLLKSIQQRAKQTYLQDKSKGLQTVIEFVDGFNNRSQANPLGGGGTSDWLPGLQRPDTGESATVSYNPSVAGLGIRDAPDPSDDLIFPALEHGFGRPKDKPSDVTLFHEMVHAEDMMYGRLFASDTPLGQGKAKVSEMRAVGLGEYRDDEFISGRTGTPAIWSENTYRHERGVKERPWYGGDEENQPPLGPDLAAPGQNTPLRQMEAVPQPYKGIDKAFTRRAKIDARKQAITGAQGRNTQREKENELIRMGQNRTALLAEVKRTNQAVLDSLQELVV